MIPDDHKDDRMMVLLTIADGDNVLYCIVLHCIVFESTTRILRASWLPQGAGIESIRFLISLLIGGETAEAIILST